MNLPKIPHGPKVPTLLLIGSGRRLYREYSLRSLAARFRIVLLDPEPASWQKTHIMGHWTADIHDAAAVRTAVAGIRGEHVLDGVVTWDEFAAVTAARVAGDLGLRGSSAGAVARCRDKAACRTVLDIAGVPSAAWYYVTSLAGARAAAVRIGYPVVLKPRAAGGSMGVIRVNSPAELEDAYRFTLRAAAEPESGEKKPGMLVESYLPGPEVSVEVVTDRGRHHVVAVTAKQLGAEPYFEETGHIVAGAGDDPGRPSAAVATVATAALDTLGISHGVSHVELRLTPSGPRIIEVNPRIGGDLIGHLVHLATGVDLAAAAGDLAVGRTPDLTPTRSQTAGIRFVYPQTAGRVHHIAVDPAIAAAPWCERAVLTQQPGDLVAPPPSGGLESRLAHIIAVAPSAEQCRARLDHASTGLHADIRRSAGRAR